MGIYDIPIALSKIILLKYNQIYNPNGISDNKLHIEEYEHTYPKANIPSIVKLIILRNHPISEQEYMDRNELDHKLIEQKDPVLLR